MYVNIHDDGSQYPRSLYCGHSDFLSVHGAIVGDCVMTVGGAEGAVVGGNVGVVVGDCARITPHFPHACAQVLSMYSGHGPPNVQ
jgi:hypothetical protein